MKKKSLKSLSLNKKSISNLEPQSPRGGFRREEDSGSGGASCTNYSDFASCNGICHSFVCSVDCDTFLCLPWEN